MTTMRKHSLDAAIREAREDLAEWTADLDAQEALIREIESEYNPHREDERREAVLNARYARAGRNYAHDRLMRLCSRIPGG